MPQFFHDHLAFGAPGIEPRWTRSDKQAVGTARSASTRIWFTIAGGMAGAVRLAAKIPGARTGCVEVRPIAEDAKTLRALGFDAADARA